MSITIEVDAVLHVAYIKLADGAVARTVDFNDQIQIDLDRFGVAVGVEVLDDNAALPFADLVNDFHVHSDVIDFLRLIRPDVSSYLEFTHGNDGVTHARGAADLTPA